MSHIIKYILLFQKIESNQSLLISPHPAWLPLSPPRGSALTGRLACFRVVERGGATHQRHPAGCSQEGGALPATGAGDAAHRHHRAAPQQCGQWHLGQEHQEVPGQGQRSHRRFHVDPNVNYEKTKQGLRIFFFTSSCWLCSNLMPIFSLLWP